jgi:site-specific recombinase XerC
MRVSELVGINMDDLVLDINEVTITRKGGKKRQKLYFNDEVKEALIAYLDIREYQSQALFIIRNKRRITTSQVDNVVKKLTKETLGKELSAHKMRSTYGTILYRETRDIYLVADRMGHSDVNTTRKHYAKMDEERQKQVAGAIKLR